MFENYIKIAWRNLTKEKAFSFINISGLSLGITCSILIALWINDEYLIDNFHENGDRIFIVTSQEFSGSEVNGSYDTPGLLGEELKTVFPEVERSCNFGFGEWSTFAVGDVKIKIGGNYAGKDFFSIFSYPLIAGNKETALNTPESIAISRKMASRLFGSPDKAIGQTLKFENYKLLKVSAVFEDLKDNVSNRFDYIINWELFVERNDWLKDWNNSGPTTFVLLKKQVDWKIFAPKIREFVKNYDKQYSKLDRLELGLQPFNERYLYSNFKNGYQSGGRIEYVQLFRLVAIFILLLACINFMNLSTARSIKRAKEIGVRKVIGAVRTSLFGQFMMEAFLFTIIAVLLSLILVAGVLPEFNNLTGKNLLFPLSERYFWIGIGVLTLITGFIAGSYPALLLASFRPISVLKSNVKMSSSSVFLRKGLVVFQFALSVVFILGMIVISRQVDYVQSKNLGYQKNNLIYLQLTGEIASHYEVFKQEALKIPGITAISLMSARPVEMENSTGSVEWEGKTPGTRPTFTQAAVGYDFIKTMQSTLLSGRDFSQEYSDSSNYIINEAALKIIGYENPIGRPLTFWGTKGKIIGVVRDFHFNSLHVPIKPLVLRLNTQTSFGYALIRSNPSKISSALAGLERLHKELNPEFPFAFQFADVEYVYSYKSEQVVQKLSSYFAVFAIFISCIGLLGLVIFTVQQRTKEVGIRKVLGAGVLNIVRLISKDFAKLIILSNLLAFPIAYFIMKKWLEGFEYHIGLEWWMFLIAAGSSLFFALLTISIQSVKAAVANPVKSLRVE